jgi:hypothetical protein
MRFFLFGVFVWIGWKLAGWLGLGIVIAYSAYAQHKLYQEGFK